MWKWLKNLIDKKEPIDEVTSLIESRKAYAKNIADEIIANHGKDSEGYIFAISAKWGEGKTKLLHLIKPKLLKADFKVIEFNVWQYAEDPETMRRVFIKHLKRKLTPPWYEPFTWQYKTIDKLDYDETRTVFRPILPRADFLLICLILLIIIASDGIWNNFGISTNLYNAWNWFLQFIKNNTAFVTLLGILIGLLALPKLLHFERKQSKVSSVDDFEDIFNEIVKNERNLVIFVDDLDRCTPERAKNVLEAIKTFFRSRYVSYVVTGDHTVLERSTGSLLDVEPTIVDGQVDLEATERERKYEGARFMQKMFNVYWKLPGLDPSEFEHYVDSALTKIKTINNERLTIIRSELISQLDRNPREITRFVGLLAFSLKSIDTRLRTLRNKKDSQSDLLRTNLEIVKDFPELLTKVLLLQEKFGQVHEYFANNPDLFREFEMRLVNGSPSGQDTELIRDLVGEKYLSKCLEFIQTRPSFYTKKEGFVASPELFFYYSGFGGEKQTGIPSSDFILRYVNADENLIDQIKNTVPSQSRDKVIKTGIENLSNISDQNQRAQAIKHLLGILSDTSLDINGEMMSQLMRSTGTLNYWENGNDVLRSEFWQILYANTLRRKSEKLLLELLTLEPFAKTKASFLGHINFPIVDEQLLKVIIDDILADDSKSVDTSAARRQFAEQCKQMINTANDQTIENVSAAVNRLLAYAGDLRLWEFIDGSFWNDAARALTQVSQGSRNPTPKGRLIIKLLGRENSIWNNTQKDQLTELELFKAGKQARRKYKQQAKDIYDKWNS